MKKRKDGRYTRRVTLPSGEKVDLYGKTQKDVNALVDETKLRYAMGAVSLKNKVTVQEWAQLWWDAEKKGRTGESSQNSYLSVLNNYVVPAIGPLKVVDVKPLHCQQLLNDMADKSKSLQRQARVVMNGVFRYAVINGLLLGNPAQYVKYTAPPDEKRPALQPGEVSELLDACMGTRAELLVHLSLYCGLRRGEAYVKQKLKIYENIFSSRYSKPHPSKTRCGFAV
jgi:integrase